MRMRSEPLWMMLGAAVMLIASPFVLLAFIGTFLRFEFIQPIEVVNDATETVWVTPVGRGREHPDWRVTLRPSQVDVEIAPGEVAKLDYDMDDIVFSELVVRDAQGVHRQLAVDTDGIDTVVVRVPSPSTLDAVEPIVMAAVEDSGPPVWVSSAVFLMLTLLIPSLLMYVWWRIRPLSRSDTAASASVPMTDSAAVTTFQPLLDRPQIAERIVEPGVREVGIAPPPLDETPTMTDVTTESKSERLLLGAAAMLLLLLVSMWVGNNRPVVVDAPPVEQVLMPLRSTVEISVEESWLPEDRDLDRFVLTAQSGSYSCYNYSIVAATSVTDESINIDIEGVQSLPMCLPAMGPASIQVYLGRDIGLGEHAVRLSYEGTTNEYRLTITQRVITLTPIYSTFSTVAAQKYDMPPHSFVLKCNPRPSHGPCAELTSLLDALPGLTPLSNREFYQWLERRGTKWKRSPGTGRYYFADSAAIFDQAWDRAAAFIDDARKQRSEISILSWGNRSVTTASIDR